MKNTRLIFISFLKNPTFLILTLILAFAFFIRIIYLNNVPPGLANDEANIVLNAQSFLKTGENIPGIITGIIGTPAGDLTAGVHSEISSYILMPWYLIFGFNFVTVKLPFIFAGLGIVILSFLIIRKTVNREAGLIAASLAAINPWLIFFSRSAYESILSAFFYLLAIFIVISQKNWRTLWALPFFIAGFLCYFSAKTIMLPLALICLFTFLIFKIKNSIKPLIVLNLILIVFLIIYLPILKSSVAGERFDELQNKQINEVVNLKRTASLDLPLSSAFENKIVEDLRIRLTASLGGLSFNFLFFNGNPENIPSLNIPDHAPLYLLDLAFVILGIIFLARHNLFFLTLSLGTILTTLIPNFLNLQGTTYTIRTVVLFPILVMLSGTGVYCLKTFLFRNWLLKIVFSFIIILYILSFANFIYQYFGRLPVEKSEGWFLTDRILSKYAGESLKSYPDIEITLITPQPKHIFYRYIFFNSLYNNSSRISEINSGLKNWNYSYHNFRMIDKCPVLNLEENSVFIIDQSMDCEVSSNTFIASIKDAGDKYKVINDKLCNGLVTQNYPLVKDINDLNIENLSQKDFCEKFIISH